MTFLSSEHYIKLTVKSRVLFKLWQSWENLESNLEYRIKMHVLETLYIKLEFIYQACVGEYVLEFITPRKK